MKRALFLILAVTLAAFSTGCYKHNSNRTNTNSGYVMTQNDLTGRNWVLMSVDGTAYTGTERVPNLMFGQDMRVSGSVCNRFTGQGHLANNRLTVRQMASTKMFCVDQELNNIENLFGQMLDAGAELSFDGNLLTISQGGHTLVYRAEPIPQ